MSPHSSPTLQLGTLAEAVSGTVVGSPDTTVSGISSLTEAGAGDLAYIGSDRVIKDALISRAVAFVVARPIPDLARPQIIVSHPAFAFARIAERFYSRPHRPHGVSDQIMRGEQVEIGEEPSIWPFVTLAEGAKIGARVTLYPGVFVGEHATVGDDCVLYPNVTVCERCILGNRVIVHGGTVIGSDGFGYVQHEGRHQKIPQLGIVVIEDDVEIGANVAVDRATFGKTLIQRGTKIDNLVQVAHNVRIGEDSIIVAQVGIAGSTTVGRHVIVGGQAGISDHVQVGDRVMIAARSGVNRSLTSDQIVSGAPVMPHEVSVKVQAVISRLPDLRQQVRTLEERVKALEGKHRKTKSKRKK